MIRKTTTAVRHIMKAYGVTWDGNRFMYGDAPLTLESVVEPKDKDLRGRRLDGWVVLYQGTPLAGHKLSLNLITIGYLRWYKEGHTRLVYELIWDPAAIIHPGRSAGVTRWDDPRVLHGSVQYVPHKGWQDGMVWTSAPMKS